jgi:hypothetical protein
VGTVVVLSAEAVEDLFGGAFVSATINVDGELVLTKGDTTTVNLGDIKEHGGLTGLGDDDHTQYALADGSRGDFATLAQGEAADNARVQMSAEIDLTGDGTDQFLEEITVSDDGTSTSGWVNRFRAYYRHRVSGTPVADNLRRLVFWLNEYGEPRVAPANSNTVAFRIFVKDTNTTQTNTRDADVPLLELMDNRTDRNAIWGLFPDGNVRITDNQIETAHVLLLGPADPVPTGTPAGTVIVRTT